MNRPTSTRGRACHGKTAHPTETRAEAHRWRLIRAGTAAGRIEVYACRHAPPGAPHWHVGHRPGGRRRAA